MLLKLIYNFFNISIKPKKYFTHLPHKFHVDLWHPVNGPGSLNANVRGRIFGGVLAESPDSRRAEETEPQLVCWLIFYVKLSNLKLLEVQKKVIFFSSYYKNVQILKQCSSTSFSCWKSSKTILFYIYMFIKKYSKLKGRKLKNIVKKL